MSEFCVYRGEFLGGNVRAVLTISDRGACIKWEPREPLDIDIAVREQFEREYHEWRQSCADDYVRRIGRTLADS